MFYFLKTRKYLIAGISAGLAILTRNVGIVLIPTLYIYAAYETYKSKKFDLSMLHVLLMPLLAFSIYLLINYDNYGDPFFFYNEEISVDYIKQLMIPFSEHLVNFSKLFDKGNILDEYFMMTRGWNAIFPFFSLVVIIFGLGKISWHYSLYAFFSIILFSSLSWGISDARYCLTVFPIYMVLAKIRNKYIILSLMGIFLILMLNFTAIFTSGRWGF